MCRALSIATYQSSQSFRRRLWPAIHVPVHVGARRMKWLGIAVAVVVAAVVLYKVKYPTYTYRYRMTVNVEVDGQVRSGSSVIEVRVSKQPVFLPGVNSLEQIERGEAVFVDLGAGRNVTALLASGTYAEKSGHALTLVPMHFKLNLGDDRQLASLSSLRGRWELATDDLPTLVIFTDPTDPATARLVRADQFEQTFGPGVRWRGVVVEMTTDAVTSEIESRLPWVARMATGLAGQTTTIYPYMPSAQPMLTHNKPQCPRPQ